MPTNWTYTWRASGAKNENSPSRVFSASAPPYDSKYRRITSITRRNGAFCNTGGTNDTATILGVETLVDTSTSPETVLLTSPQSSCRVRGRNTSGDNYMTTEFADIPVSVSHKIIAAWKKGTLEIRRALTLGKHSDRSCRKPFHRDGYKDDITLTGTDSAYLPAFTAASFSASDADRLYADTWQDPPFDFALQTNIESSAYWESKTTLVRRLTISAANLTDPDAPAMKAVSVSTDDISSTSWSLTQADFDFSAARSNGFARGCRYRVDFTLAVGVDADNLSEETVFSAEIDVVAVPLHLSRRGNGVAIGRYSSVTEDETDTLFECAYPARFYAGIEDYANSVFSTQETDTGGRWLNGEKIYRCVFTGSTTKSGEHVSIGNFPSTPVNVLNFYGSFRSKADGKTRPLPFASYASNDWNISPAIDGQALELYIGASNKGGEYWLIFEYTKEG